MDSLLKLGKQAYEQYSESQQQGGHGASSQQQGQYRPEQDAAGQPGSQNYNVGGGAQYNEPSYGNSQSIQGIDLQAATQHAQNTSDQDGSLFSSALGFLQQKQQSGDTDVDEDDVQRSHAQAYQQGNAGNLAPSAMGSAAALEALKKFTSGGASGQSSGAPAGGSSALIGMAMKEAAKLFDNSGASGGQGKQEAVNSAGATMLKLLLKSQMSGMIGGGSSGGLGGLMSQASKFM